MEIIIDNEGRLILTVLETGERFIIPYNLNICSLNSKLNAIIESMGKKDSCFSYSIDLGYNRNRRVFLTISKDCSGLSFTLLYNDVMNNTVDHVDLTLVNISHIINFKDALKRFININYEKKGVKYE